MRGCGWGHFLRLHANRSHRLTNEMGNLCECRTTSCTDGDQASAKVKKEEEVDAAPQCYSDIFYEYPPQEVTVRTAQGNTAVHIFNSEANDTVLIVHGAGGRKEQFEESRIAQCLASTPYRVITFDWYGHGSSSEYDIYNKENFLEQMNSVVDTLIPEGQRFHLYGFSMGCFLSLHYIRLNPERIDRSVLHSPWNGEMGVFCTPCPGSVVKSTLRIPLLGIHRSGDCAALAFSVLSQCYDVKENNCNAR